jgi:hypothetical protein
MLTKDWDRDDLEAIRLKTAEKLSWSEIEYSQDGYLVGHGPGRRDLKVVPSYARDVKAAWEIVEKLNRNGANVHITNPRKGVTEYEVEIRFPGGNSSRATHEKIAAAICMAFLESRDVAHSSVACFICEPLAHMLPKR